MVIVVAINKWRPYLIGRHFTIKTDHHSLKYLLEQRISTPSQQNWLAKLMGYNYTIVYKKVKKNLVADALSKCVTTDIHLHIISTVTSTFLVKVQKSYIGDPQLQKVLAQL